MPAPKPSASPFSMTPDEYRAALARLRFDDAPEGERAALNDAGYSRAARFFGASTRAGQNWAAGGPPAPVAVALRLMLAARIDYPAACALFKRARR